MGLILQRRNHWRLGLDTCFHPTKQNRCNYMLRSKLICVSKRGPGIFLKVIPMSSAFIKCCPNVCFPLVFMKRFFVECSGVCTSRFHTRFINIRGYVSRVSEAMENNKGLDFCRLENVIIHAALIWLINTLQHGGTISWHVSGSTLAQVMSCFLMGPSHFLNQCWLIISEVLRHSHGAVLQEIPQSSISEISLKSLT